MCRALAFWSLLATAACGPAPGPPPPSVEVTLREVQDRVFTPNCALSSCHGDPNKSGGLSLVDGKSAAGLINVEPTLASARAKGYKRVVPGEPAKSFLYIKCFRPSADEGEPMPLGENLSKEKVELIKKWIESGAR
jgi:hypothetical protein